MGRPIMKTSLRQVAKPQHPSQPRRNNRPRPRIPPAGQHPRRRFLGLAAGAVALPTMSRIAHAQAYPTPPITMIVQYPAGGPAVVIGRLLAERMRVLLGQPVIIESVSGALPSLGTGRGSRARPD